MYSRTNPTTNNVYNIISVDKNLWVLRKSIPSSYWDCRGWGYQLWCVYQLSDMNNGLTISELRAARYAKRIYVLKAIYNACIHCFRKQFHRYWLGWIIIFFLIHLQCIRCTRNSVMHPPAYEHLIAKLVSNLNTTDIESSSTMSVYAQALTSSNDYHRQTTLDYLLE